MRIIAGLGNPGQKHQNQRHNVGFMAADAIARRHSFSPWSKKFQGLVAEGNLGGEKVLIIKPQTYMNLSGQAVGEAMRFYKLGLDDLIVLYDEIDLAAAKVRVKTGGGSGGHNGIRSLDAHCGAGYRRVRIGIGHPGVKELVHGHVLGDFAKADADWLEPLLDAVADAAPMLVAGDDNGFMNKVSLAVQRGGGSSGGAPAAPGKPAAKGQSHIRQARPKQTEVKMPESGPMAAMLKKLFGKD
ncbi:MAG: aminoacyl-tRNA hydrolase [Rhizobiaceae bacterium]